MPGLGLGIRNIAVNKIDKVLDPTTLKIYVMRLYDMYETRGHYAK